ncbi:glycosyltransferase [Collinsella tanakaei]|nr:glycosyltransferase [Collinsella tanakaei]
MSRVRVSASVVVYRDYASPLQMLSTLASQTDPGLPVRVYAVDNSALADGDPMEASRERFRADVGNLGFVEYVDAGANLGFGRANNLALSMADSDYHAFVNPDVAFEGDALSALASFLDARPDAGMAIPRMLGEDGGLQPVYRREVTVLDALNRTLLGNRLRKRDRWHTMADADYSAPFRVPFGQGSFLFGRTALLKELGGFDDRFFMYLEDADLCRRVNEVSQLWYCPDATVIHRWERGSHKSARLMRAHLASYAAYFRKWGLRLA